MKLFAASRVALLAVAFVCPYPTILTAAEAPAAKSVTFAELVASVSKPPAETVSVDDQALTHYRASNEGVKVRQSAVLAKAVGVDPGDSPNGKQSMRVDIARLTKDISDTDAVANVLLVAPFNEDDSHFTKIMLAYLYGRFGDKLPPNVIDALRKQAIAYDQYFDVETENHIGMQRVSAAIFGAAWPDMTTKFGSGKELQGMGEDWIRRYGRTVFHSGMKEFLSPIYLGVHNEIWLTGSQFAPTESSRLASSAMRDWLWTDLAINSNLGQVIPPAMRSKLMLDRGPQTSYPQSHAQWLAWLYWGDLHSKPGSEPLAPVAAAIKPGESIKQMMKDNDGFQTAILPATTELIPNQIIRNIGAKEIALPYMLLQSRPHGEVTTAVGDNEFSGKRPRRSKDELRNYLRSVYVARDYTLSAGYVRKETDGDNENCMHLFPTALSYCSTDALNSIIVAQPYWYSGKPTGHILEANEVFGLDCWLGKSPFEQLVHWENAAVYLYDIPDKDPHLENDAKLAKQETKAFKNPDKLKLGKGKWTSTRAETPLKNACIYVPESIDETRQTPWGWFLREGDVYIALRPFGHRSATWETCKNSVQAGYKRLVLEGSRFGVVVEVGDSTEYGTADAFIAKVGSTKLDTTKLESTKQVIYVSSRQTTLQVRFNDDSWFPDASVKDAKLDFENWPICESPYVKSRDGVLDVNDGKQGFKIDWHGDWPVYSSYKVQ